MKIVASELAELLVSWQLKLRAENKSPRTLRAYSDGVKQFLRWCDDTGTPPVLTKVAAQGFLSSLLDNGAESNTVRARYSALKRFSKWLAREGETPIDLLTELGAPSLHTKVVDPLTEDELRGFIKACQGNRFQDRRDEALVRLMAETGVRAGECAALKFVDIDTVAGRAIVYRGKGGKGRIVHFGPQTAAVLDRYMRARRSHRLAATSALWLGERSTTFSYASLYRTLLKRAELAGIDDFHPHKFRHTAATRWLAAGGSEGGLMAMAGWQSREMLDRYTAATASERAADEARRLNLGDL
jgi:integrase/recombinase XerD